MSDDGVMVDDTSGSSSVTIAPAPLAVSVTHRKGTAVITCRGDLDLGSQAALRGALADVVRLAPDLVAVDLSRVGFFDCGAIGEFISARATLRERGSTLVLRSPSIRGLRLLSAAGLLDLVSIASLPDIQVGAVPRAAECAATEVALLSEAWRTDCESHPSASSPLVFADPQLIVSKLVEVLEDTSPELTAADVVSTRPNLLSCDDPGATVAVLQLIALSRVVQAWISWTAPRHREHELQRRLAEVMDASIVAVVSSALTRLESEALTDPLTGLLNRRALERDFTQFLAAARRHGRALTVVMIDLVGLKQINDRYGHDEGDEAICSLARSLGSCLRVGDNVYRIGGDEFVVLLPDLSPEDIDAVMDRMIVSAGGAFTWGSAGVPTDVHSGAADGTPAALLALADNRMLAHRARHQAHGVDSATSLGASEEKSRFSGGSVRLVGELRAAGNAHVLIEQAKGIIAEHFDSSIDAASETLDAFSLSRQEPLHLIAAGLVDRTISASALTPSRFGHESARSDTVVLEATDPGDATDEPRD